MQTDQHLMRIHPDNSKIFSFRGKPLILLCATEHYGAVMNRPFRIERYLDDAAEKGQTLTRLFTLFRELQTAINPYSTCKPESPDYIAPFARTGPGRALDGEPRYDLERWNPEFFKRLHTFLRGAEERDIIVELVLFSNTYSDSVWGLNPLNPANNITLRESIPWFGYLTCRHPELFMWQRAYLRRIVEETNCYENIFYEVCNEPGAFINVEKDLPAIAEVNHWQNEMIALIREVESGMPRQHLIAGQEAMFRAPSEQPSDATFEELDFDIVNIHPLPNTTYRGRSYDMGAFMSKELKLRAVQEFALATYTQAKPLNYDEDNVASRYLDPDGWTIHRKRAWTSLFCGTHYDMIDFSIRPHLETGNDESQKCIRRWLAHLAMFIHSLDLVRARPLTGWLHSQPDHTLASVFAVEEEDYCIYLADEREVEIAGCGKAIEGKLCFDLPKGEFGFSCFSPVNGVESPEVKIVGGIRKSVNLPPFEHDLVVRVRLRNGVKSNESNERDERTGKS